MSAPALAARPRDFARPWQPPEVEPRDIELVAQVLSDGTVGEDGLVLATSLLHGCGGVANLPRTSRSQLVAAGLSMAQAARVKDAVALASRLFAAPPPGRELDRAAAIALLRPLFAPLEREELHVVFLGGDGTFRGRQALASGGYAALVVHARDVLTPALEAHARAIVLAHNHPSGQAAPSPEDVSFTDRVDAASQIVGVRLVDHLVFGREGVASAMSGGARWPQGGPRRAL